MNKKELIKAMSAKTGYTQKDVAETIDAMITVIGETLKAGEDVNIVGFGKFVSKVVPAHQARNPKDGTMVDVPERTQIKFKPSTVLKDIVNL